MNKYTIKSFCKLHDACDDGREWALENCKTMDDAWNTAKPEWLLWIATREGVLSNKELRSFAVFCARQVQHLMEDTRSINAIDVAERFANGLATNEELAAARDDSWDASDASSDAARAARAAVSDAAWSPWVAARAACAAVNYAASYACADASYAAREAAWVDSDAWHTSWAAQSKWLRENTKPNFSK